MAVSASGLLTLLFLIFIGPIIYACQYVYKKFVLRSAETEDDPSMVVKEEGEREELTSNQCLYALIGYAIGMCLHSYFLASRFTHHMFHRDWQHLALPLRYR